MLKKLPSFFCPEKNGGTNVLSCCFWCWQTTRPTETQVLLGIMGNKSKIPLAAELTSKLWGAKLKAEFVVSTRFDKIISRAIDSKIPWMVLVRDRELETGKVKIKNLETKIEEEVPLSAFVDEVKNRLNLWKSWPGQNLNDWITLPFQGFTTCTLPCLPYHASYVDISLASFAIW